MRSRGMLIGTLLGMVLSAGGQTGCAEERKYRPPSAGDGGTQDAGNQTGSITGGGDASVGASESDAQSPSDGGANTIGEISVTLGIEDASIFDAAGSTNTDTAMTTTGLPDTSTSPASDTGAGSTTDAGVSGPTPPDAAVGTSSSETSDVSIGDASVSDAAVSADADSGPSCEMVSQVETDCANDQDEDCDGLLGCEDLDDCGTSPECQPACVEVASSELNCGDEVDDDCDGFEDCDDTDCALDVACIVDCVPVTEDCTDGQDNDCDGFDDCDDSECAATTDCCTVEGVEVCDDGVDNDCDGEIDCPTILDTVPSMPPPGRESFEGGAVSADMATLTLDAPVLDGYVVQCRSGKPAAVGNETFTVCDSSSPSSLEVTPFDSAEGSDATYDGLMTTEVRFAYPNGQVSATASFSYYVHSSLYGAATCPEKATDAEYFAAAESYLLADDGTTFQDADAHLASPFVNIAFTPPMSTRFEVADDAGTVEYLSLRRRFVLNADKNLILMKRVYKSRTNALDDCRAATIRKHASDDSIVYDETRYFRNRCDAIVINREGAGVCLLVDDNVISIANPNSQHWQTYNFIAGWVNWAQADNFMWRKLLGDSGGAGPVFSRKCYQGGSACAGAGSNTLYLPDRDLFGL